MSFLLVNANGYYFTRGGKPFFAKALNDWGTVSLT